MKMELIRGKKGNLVLKITFEEASNFWRKDLTWTPTIDEMKSLNEALNMCLKWEKK